MKSFKIVLLAIAFAFISSSIAFASGVTARPQDHNFRIGLSDAASEKDARDEYRDSIAFSDHSFREGVQLPEREAVQSTESASGVRGYYPETDMQQELGITDADRNLLIDGPAD
jgi:hypothetical protein